MASRRRPVDHFQMRTCICDACERVAHSYPSMTHRHCAGSRKRRKGAWQPYDAPRTAAGEEG